MALPGSVAGLSLNTVGEAIAFAAGIALGPALDPIATALVQEAWKVAPIRAVDATTAAAIVAEAVELGEWGKGEAAQHGIDPDRFDAILGEVLNAPGFAELVTMLRRGTIGKDLFDHGLRKAKIETEWDGPLEELEHERLTPAQVALGIVRSVIRDPGLLAVTLDTADSNVARYPVSAIDALLEAAAGGIDPDRLRVMVGEIGLPMPIVRAAAAHFRGILTLGAYNQAALEGDTRPEWAAAILDEARQIITAHDGIEDHLRGWSDADAMYAQTARHGMSKEDTDILFRISGRPPSPHQVFIGLRRGGVYDGPTDHIDPAFLKSLRESNVRPEWYNLEWAARFTYPAAFVLRSLTQSGEYTAEQTETILLYEGWEPTLAHDTATKWAATPATSGSSLSAKAKTSALTALHKSYVSDRTDETKAKATMTRLDVPAGDQTAAIAIWNEERAIVREELTPTQIKKAIGQPGKDKAWALERLLERGYNADDAGTFLAE